MEYTFEAVKSSFSSHIEFTSLTNQLGVKALESVGGEDMDVKLTTGVEIH